MITGLFMGWTMVKFQESIDRPESSKDLTPQADIQNSNNPPDPPTTPSRSPPPRQPTPLNLPDTDNFPNPPTLPIFSVIYTFIET